jgi:hypothetical protein
LRSRCVCANGAGLEQDLKRAHAAIREPRLGEEWVHRALVQHKIAGCLRARHVLAFHEQRVSLAVNAGKKRNKRMLHLDIKRLVRIQRPSHRVTGNRRDGVKGIGAEFLHVAIDDHSRLAFTAMYPDQTERSSTHFLAEAVAWYGQLGIAIRKILTDNGALL